jgi:hypothetical protein
MKRIVILGGAALVSGALLVSFQKCYIAREAMVVVGALGVAYAVVLLLVVLSVLVFHGTTGIFSWIRIQRRQWHAAPAELAFAFIPPGPAIAKPVPIIR